MSERQEVIERLKALELEGGSHEMLSSIAKAIYKPTCGGWTIGACQVLRDTLVNLLSETDEEALREAYTKGREDGMGVANKADMQAEYLRGKNDGYDEGYDEGLASADDWLGQHEDAMAEHGWVRLPKDGEAPCNRLGEWIEKRGLITGPLDHDGELWHSGDMSDSNWGEIEGIAFENGRWLISGHDTSAPWIPADSISHYHAPTVEDTLREMLDKWGEMPSNMTNEAIIAEYAAKLQLRGDAE